MNVIDLRSDTVTRPTPAMRAAMASAEVGDDVYGEDPTVNRLEALGAGLTGKEAALFVPTGTMANLLAIMVHCGRGDEYICGQEAHCYRFEGGGAAVLGSVQPQPLDFEPDGTLDLVKAARFVKPDDPHCARTRLLCLENTMAGKVLPLPYLEQAGTFCRERGLTLHLDGARLANAAVKLDVPLADVARPADTVSLCLSKGLGAPAGTLLCGSAPFVTDARRLRKMLGGGMRQAGILAAAGIVALTEQVARLADDHAHAALLARGLAEIDELAPRIAPVQTNMVLVDLDRGLADSMAGFLKGRGILVAGRERLRLVTHLDVTRYEIICVVKEIKNFFVQRAASD
jgi:threonine aldolase